MRKITEVLRLKFEAKLSHDQVARAVGLSKGVVGKYVSLAKARSSFHFLRVPSNRIRLAYVQDKQSENGRLETPTGFNLRATVEKPTSVGHRSSGFFRLRA
ncbi:MAG: hypothetical protein U9Q81_04815 [Pseudomonadota bacterium]|nr:hypothetical protein [Pseudomonadota bacterium]